MRGQYPLATTINHSWHLAARPNGYPKRTDFELRQSPIPSPGPGIASGGRVVICGQIAQYNATLPPQGPRIIPHMLLSRQARMEGFCGSANSKTAIPMRWIASPIGSAMAHSSIGKT